MTELDTSSPYLSVVGRILITYNIDEFTERFQQAVSAGATKGQVTKVMENTLGDAVGILMENGYDAVGAPLDDYWLYAFFVLADMGMDAYMNGEVAREDARCLTDSNYASFSKGTGTRPGGEAPHTRRARKGRRRKVRFHKVRALQAEGQVQAEVEGRQGEITCTRRVGEEVIP